MKNNEHLSPGALLMAACVLSNGSPTRAESDATRETADVASEPVDPAPYNLRRAMGGGALLAAGLSALALASCGPTTKPDASSPDGGGKSIAAESDNSEGSVMLPRSRFSSFPPIEPTATELSMPRSRSLSRIPSSDYPEMESDHLVPPAPPLKNHGGSLAKTTKIPKQCENIVKQLQAEIFSLELQLDQERDNVDDCEQDAENDSALMELQLRFERMRTRSRSGF